MSLFLASLERPQLGLVAALAVSLICVIAIVWSVGSTDRVTYLGPDHGQEQTIAQVRLKTLPQGSYVIERGAIYKAMRAGCRYDVNYSPQVGRHVSARQRTKYIRSAVLVDCPSS
ncbi:hypothetical protein LPJ38_24760 [Bradyrhizobium daqingense]|uniref:Uncharacterized protein n=1 Tax=Bradyrhizobium daqingense TaxID=993502 RepID=A0A562LC33_9BRAD|nr:hypothetical protein [Bradyrhizobium daqingense]TWI05252.1 hypothetical protein IQ17_03421 [Bradyrhizobium daqingense]UFS86862.1 hypothetical protein LPJ38_24760 [Bradyrhizobium daqingense]